MKTKISIAAIGDVTKVDTFSGTPYYFLQAANEADWLVAGWQMNLNKLNIHRAFWNFFKLLTFRQKGGYQYSKHFANMVLNQISPSLLSNNVISLTQHFPPAEKILEKGGQLYYYIDTTLDDLFKDDSYGLMIPKSMQIAAIKREKKNYEQAKKVITMGSWSHLSLKKVYGLPKEKIGHILPGANIKISPGLCYEPMPGAGKERDLVLGFIGKDWKRKGLPILLDVRDELAKRGYKVIVKAIGNCPEELKNRNGLEYTGFINKQINSNLFIDFITSCDIGCLFSKGEALGISILEFLSVGVPVAGYYHQGLIDTLFENSSIRCSLNDSVVEIANGINKYIEDISYQKEIKKGAKSNIKYVSWERAVKEWDLVLKQH